MSEERDKTLDELREAYEADKERRNVREDELQAAKDYLGVLLQEIEDKNKELEAKRAEVEGLADALKKSEVEKQEEVNANIQVRESVKYKSIWIGIAIIEFLAIIAVVASLFFVYDKLKTDYEDKIKALTEEKDNPPQITETVTPAPATARLIEDLKGFTSGITVRDGFKCSVDVIDGLEYLVFSKDDFRICYKNEYYLEEKKFKKAVVLEKGDKRIYEHFEYDFDRNPDVLCPMFVKINGTELALLTDYEGFGSMPETLRMYDVKDLTEYNGDDLHGRINKLLNASFSDSPSGLTEYPILLELKTSKATYRYGLTDAGFNETGYSFDESNGTDICDISSNFRLNISEEGITWQTVGKLGRRYYLGDITGELTLGYGTVLINNAKFGAFAPANTEDPELLGTIIPAESIPERYITVNGNNSERFYIAISDDVTECSYDWTKLDSSDPNNWVYYDEDGKVASIKGIDVSKYQGVIDWKKVAKAGVKFAMIRMGYRGMNEGTLELDPYFEANMQGASEEGINIGIYFFSQAISVEEAEEEANYVAGVLSRYEITYPVVFDTEKVTTYNARANDLSMKERTDICIAFCEKIAKQDYIPMIYANTKYMIMGIDLTRLEKYDKWYAYYNPDITFPYDFEMLQYSDTGTIPGIKGSVDLNISFIDYAKSNVKNNKPKDKE